MIYELLFPNEEIRKSMEQIIIEAVGEKSPYYYTEAIKDLVEGNVKSFSDFLKDYMRYTPSYFDTSDRYKER